MAQRRRGGRGQRLCDRYQASADLAAAGRLRRGRRPRARRRPGLFRPADPAYLNGIVAHPDGSVLLVASQGEGGTLWRADLANHTAAPVDLGGYEFNADGMLLDGEVLYGVTNRGGDIENVRFMISVARLAPGWRSAAIVAELADPDWDCPTTIAKVNGQLLIVCSQVRAMHTKTPPRLPFEIASTDLPNWT